MTTISSLSGTDASAQVASMRRQPPRPPDMTNTAKALGLSADDLQSELRSGRTLDSIAQDKGVSRDDLLSAVKTDLQANKPADAPALSDDQLTQMATSIAAGKGPGGPGGPGGGHHHHGGGGGQATASILGTSASDTSSNLSSLADALGRSSDDLLSQLSSGGDVSSAFGQSGSATWNASGASTSGLAVDTYA